MKLEVREVREVKQVREVRDGIFRMEEYETIFFDEDC